MLSLEYWDKAAEFHGHKCPGLAIGFKAVEGAIDQLGLSADAFPAIDEELVCVTENDACCVDAIQVLLSCTYGKSNLIPRLRGKMAFSFYSRTTGKNARLVLKPNLGEGKSREEYMNFLVNTPYDQLFEVKSVSALPEQARLFDSQPCSVCGESTAEYGLRIQNGKPVCLDCYDAYQREGF